MVRTAGIFFGDLNRVLIEYVILQVCKITDPAQDIRKNDNHTIAFLLDHYGLSGDAKLAAIAAKLKAFGDKLRPARNKLISHADRATILAQPVLGAATDAEWDEFWLDLQDFICVVRQQVLGGPPFYLCGVGMPSDADGVLKALRHASCFERLLGDEDPTVSAAAAALAFTGS